MNVSTLECGRLSGCVPLTTQTEALVSTRFETAGEAIAETAREFEMRSGA